MGGNHGTGIHHGIAERLRLVALAALDPHRIQTERRVLGCNAIERPEYLAGVDRQLAIRIDLRLGQADAHQRQAIGIGQQIEIVADMHRRHEKAEILRQLLAHALDSRQQLAPLIAIDQRNQPVADLQPDHVHRRHVVPAEFLGFRRALRWQQLLLLLHILLGLLLDALLPIPDPVGAPGSERTEAEE